MALSSSGIGSNLDVDSIVSQLMSIERKPLTEIAKKEASYNTKLSAYGSLKGSISQFQTAMRSLVDPSKFQGMQVSSTDYSVINAVASTTGSSGATPGTYSLQVTKLAQAQKMVAAGQSSVNAPIGADTTSTLTFDFGTITGGSFDEGTGKYTNAGFTSSGSGVKTVTINGTNNSLEGIRDAINAANIGVTATVLNDGSDTPYRLALTVNQTGKTSSLKISVSGDASVAGLLSHDPSSNTGQAFRQTSAAQNAEFTVDGIAVTKTTNSANDVIPGVNLTLSKTGGPTSVTLTRDTTALTASINSFVKAYNDLAATLRDAGAYNATTKSAAALNGDSALRAIQSQVRGILNTPVAGDTTAYTLLSQVGVSFQKDGMLSVDTSKLNKAIDSNFSGIAGLFSKVGKASDSLVAYSASTDKTKAGNYAVSIDQLARQASTTAVGPAHTPGKGSITGSAAAALEITGSNDTLDVTVDGISHTINLDQMVYADADALADAVKTKINAAFLGDGKSVTVTQTNGVLKITSDSAGTSSAVNVAGGNGKTSVLGAQPAVVAGSQTSVADGSNTLEVQIDGITATVTLAAGNYSYAALAAEIQSKINGKTEFSSAGAAVSVTESGGVFTITSNRYGAASTAVVSGGTAKAALFGAPSKVLGLDVSGTINGVAATGNGQILTGASGSDVEGLALTILGGSTGNRGTVTFSQGYAYQFDKLATALLATDGPLNARTNGINTSLKNLSATKDRLNDRLADTEKRYRAQFAALDKVISSMTQTSNYLTQQLANLPKIE
ncbi:flagellar hook protein FliD [Herbaspirillum sp. HC18]|nr:flagellar hook protein FliD [Herbaspirillum sp. HC18]